MAQLGWNEQGHDATLTGQFQPAFHERHREIGIVLVATVAGGPEQAVTLGEALA